MSLTTANVSSIEKKSSNPFKGVENVIDLPLDEKLKLQLEVKEIKKHLEELKDATVTGTVKKLDDTYKDLFDINKNNTLSELKSLQSNVENEYTQLQKSNAKVKSLDEIQKTVGGLMDKIGSQNGIDKFAENLFDERALRNNNLYTSTEDLETAFNQYMQTEFSDTLSDYIDRYKDQEISDVLKTYRFELENLEGYTFTTGGNNSPIYDEETGYETEINTANIMRQKQSGFQYATISEDEQKKSLVDNYKRKGKDREKALQNILNTLESKTNKGIKNINEDEFVAVLKDILAPEFLSGIEDVAGSKTGIIEGNNKYETRYKDEKYQKEFKKEFKNQFQEKFIRTGKYEKSGMNMLQRSENGKIADIVFAYQKGDPSSELAQDLKRLISAEELDVHYTGEWNAEYLLKKKVNVDNTFKFLCDFNSDGKVDGGKEAKDVGAVMGLQLYENLLDAGAKEYDESKKEYRLIDGKDTSKLIEHILLSVSSREKIDSTLRTAIEYFIAVTSKELSYNVKDENDPKKTVNKKISINTGRDANGNITIENFLNFMKGGFVFNETVPDADQKVIDNKLKTTAGFDVKEYLRMHGDKLNAKRDVAELFLDPEEIGNRTLTASRDFYESSENIKDSYRRVIAGEQIEKSHVDRSAMKTGLEKFTDSEIAAAKNSIIDKMAIVAMTITDHIFFNLGDNTEAWINMFGGALGSISSTWFKDKESITRNKKEIKNALGKYILSRMMPNISLSVARNADGNLCPVIGVGVGIDRLVTGKDGRSNRRGASIGTGFLMDLANIKDSRFMFSVGAEYARQTKKNQATVQDLSKKYLLPVKRIGVEGGFGLSLKNASPYIGVFCELDPMSGVRQSEEVYQSQMDKILFGGGPAFDIFSGDQKEGMPIYTDKASFASAMKANIDEKNPNKVFLEDEIDQLADLMERGGTFSLMQKPELSEKQKKEVLKYVYMSYIEGAKENASINKINTVDKKIMLTRVGARFNVKEVLKLVGVGAATGALGGTAAGPRGTVIGCLIGATAASIRMTRYENTRKYDIDKGLFNYKTIGNMHALKDKKEDWNDIPSYAKSLESEVNGRIKYISVTGEEKDGKGTMTFSKDPAMKGKDDILQYMNVYYSDEALQSGAFSYDGTNLILGQTDFSTYKVINKDTDEVFLMIGNNEKGPLKQLTAADKNISWPATQSIEKVPTKSIPMTIDQLKTLKAALPEGGDQKVLDDLHAAYLKELDAPNSILSKRIGTNDFVNGKIFATRDEKGNFSFEIKDDGPNITASLNKVELIYEQTISKGKENIGGEIEWSSDVELSAFFEISEFSELQEAKNNLEDVIDELVDLEKETKWKSKKSYLNYMSFISNINEGNRIDDDEIKKSIAQLKAKDMLGEEGEKPIFTKIIKILNGDDYLQKSFVLDELKGIFAKNEEYLKLTINSVVAGRGNSFATKLVGPLKKTFGTYDKKLPVELINKKDEILKEVGKEKFNNDPNKAPNIIGYTAYYRNGNEIGNINQRYSMTAIGETTMQGKELPISDEFQAPSRNWFLDNLEKNTYEIKLIGKMIENKTGITLDQENILKLLKEPGKEITIEGEKKKITLDSTMVFYLAGSCANESVGIRIDKITSEDKTQDHNVEETVVRYQGKITPDASEWKYNTDGTWRDGTLNSTYEVRTKERNLGITAKVGPKKQTYGQPTPEGTAGEGRDPSNPNGNSGGGEGKDPGDGTFGQSGSEGP